MFIMMAKASRCLDPRILSHDPNRGRRPKHRTSLEGGDEGGAPAHHDDNDVDEVEEEE